MKKKLLSLLILAALALSLLPAAQAAELEETAGGPANAWGIPADDVIWYGVYKDEPVDWLVLDPDATNMGTEGVYLFSRGLIDKSQVVFDEDSTLWEGSLAQEWCTNFAQTAFSPAESALIPYTDKHEEGAYLYVLDWRPMDLKQEQVFFLSVVELDHYFGSSGPAFKTTIKYCSLEDDYWRRSPVVYHDDYHGIVLQNNTIHDYLPYHRWSARPCMNLSLQDALWVLPADDAGEQGPAARPEGAAETAREWKLLIPTEDSAFRAETIAAEDGVLTVSYSGAQTGDEAMLSLLIRDAQGQPLRLERLERPAAEAGELSLELEKLEVPEDGSLFLFCEQLGGQYRTNYAGGLSRLETSIQVPETPAPLEYEQSAEEAATEQEAPADQTQPETPSGGIDLWRLLPDLLLGLIALALIAAAIWKRTFRPILVLLLMLLVAALVILRMGGTLYIF